MIKILELVTELNDLKVRAEFLADHIYLLAKDTFNPLSANGTTDIEEDFTKWGIFKFIFKGSTRLHRLISSINVVFDKIEQDIEEIIATKTSDAVAEDTNAVTEIKEEN